MSASLVGSEMCIRDRPSPALPVLGGGVAADFEIFAADAGWVCRVGGIAAAGRAPRSGREPSA
eukprot:14167834-Alexandrium_andersonii.AAC.1